jgi:hypothetical protein
VDSLSSIGRRDETWEDKYERLSRKDAKERREEKRILRRLLSRDVLEGGIPIFWACEYAYGLAKAKAG